MAENSREAGLQMVLNRLATGRLRVFRSCRNWQAEYRLYRRNPEGKVIKAHDHLMDGTRYLVISGLSLAKQKPPDVMIQQVAQSGTLTRAGY
jgi:hypothetical protein